MTNTAQPVVSLAHASKAFGIHSVLKDISLEIFPGEVVCIIGPSGGGKSTLLRCLTLLERLDQGTLSYQDLTVATQHADTAKSIYAKEAILQEARGRFGLVFQNYNLFPHFDIMRNIVDAPICVQKRNRDEVTLQAAQLIERMGLSGCEHKMPCQLSGGQQQRVSIARALALNPQVLFFDEPTAALDPELTAEIQRVIADLAHDGMTMVIVTHEMAFAREVADRVIFMDEGIIVEEGTAEDLIERPQKARTREFLQQEGTLG